VVVGVFVFSLLPKIFCFSELAFSHCYVLLCHESRFITHRPKMLYNTKANGQGNTGPWNSRINIHTLNGSRTFTLCKISVYVTCYTSVLNSVCCLLHHKLWSFSLTKDEAAVLHTVVTQPFGPMALCLPAQSDKGTITAAPAPPCQSLFCPPPTLTHLVLVSWVARELARLCTWPVPFSPPTGTDIATVGCANISYWMGDQIS
jgi:hypothetical protein